jgi:hypothetical protein
MQGCALSPEPGKYASRLKEDKMAVNKPTGDNARKGAVRKRSQLKGKLAGKIAWTKRNRESGQFMDVKKSDKRFKGVRREQARGAR